jgi:Domain of unknown function (DUF4150)
MASVYANGNSISHSGDGEQFIALAPDVCKTPSPAGPVPVPYPNTAMSSDLASGSTSVKIAGNPVALADSNIKMSTGDEAGSAGGGVVSSKIKGKVTWLLYSMDVKFEGKGVVRFLDSTMHNGNAGNSPGKNKGKPGMAYPGGAGDIKCDNCGKSVGDPSHKQLYPTKESAEAAEKAKPRSKPARERPMKAAVVINCKKGSFTFTGVAGDQSHDLNTLNFKSLYRNIKSDRPLLGDKAPTDTNTPGNCSEQKALFAAAKAKAFPPGHGCSASLSVVQEAKEWERGAPVFVHQSSCPTCKRVLTSMMCENLLPSK